MAPLLMTVSSAVPPASTNGNVSRTDDRADGGAALQHLQHRRRPRMVETATPPNSMDTRTGFHRSVAGQAAAQHQLLAVDEQRVHSGAGKADRLRAEVADGHAAGKAENGLLTVDQRAERGTAGADHLARK